MASSFQLELQLQVTHRERIDQFESITDGAMFQELTVLDTLPG
jgi:hypothetical protein